jgi:hypothetical protein
MSKSNTPRGPGLGPEREPEVEVGSNQLSTSYSPWMSMTSAFVKTGDGRRGLRPHGDAVEDADLVVAVHERVVELGRVVVLGRAILNLRSSLSSP